MRSFGRVLMVLLGLDSIREATFLFRGPNRLTPSRVADQAAEQGGHGPRCPLLRPSRFIEEVIGCTYRCYLVYLPVLFDGNCTRPLRP
jgi:hypothetical protein